MKLVIIQGNIDDKNNYGYQGISDNEPVGICWKLLRLSLFRPLSQFQLNAKNMYNFIFNIELEGFLYQLNECDLYGFSQNSTK